MEAPITLKLKHGDDIRRFSVPQDISFEDLRVRVVKSFRFTNWPLLKYIDDEGDDISITCTEELVEAFRLIKSGGSGNRILHICVFETTVPAVVDSTEEIIIVHKKPVVESAEQKQYPSLPVCEWDAPTKTTNSNTPYIVQVAIKEDACKEYPRIPVAEWDAFIKKPSGATEPVPVVITTEEPLTGTVSSRTQQYCTDTSKDVAMYVKKTVEDTLAASKTTYATKEGDESFPVICDKLRKDCEQLCSANALLMGGLALTTLQQCQRLSEETAAMCNQLAKLQAADTTNEDERAGLKAEVSSLSSATKGDCDALSDATLDEIKKASNNVRAMIMGL